MSRSHEGRTDVAALRPWPFGPPLWGRAPRRNVGSQAAPRRGTAPRHEDPTFGHMRRQALAPFGGLARPNQTCYAR
jgi:hypothetical protein